MNHETFNAHAKSHGEWLRNAMYAVIALVVLALMIMGIASMFKKETVCPTQVPVKEHWLKEIASANVNPARIFYKDGGSKMVSVDDAGTAEHIMAIEHKVAYAVFADDLYLGISAGGMEPIIPAPVVIEKPVVHYVTTPAKEGATCDELHKVNQNLDSLKRELRKGSTQPAVEKKSGSFVPAKTDVNGLSMNIPTHSVFGGRHPVSPDAVAKANGKNYKDVAVK